MSFFFSMLFLCVFTSLFPLLSSPISLGSLMVCMSFVLVLVMNITQSAWYSYLLFLVYIGGMMVLFIYMCLISSNTKVLEKYPKNMLLLSIGLMVVSWGLYSNNWCALGKYTYDSGTSINLSLFMCLVITLLFVFLAVVDIVKINSSLQIE